MSSEYANICLMASVPLDSERNILINMLKTVGEKN